MVTHKSLGAPVRDFRSFLAAPWGTGERENGGSLFLRRGA